jgi:glycerate dehydrogenase
MMKIVFLDKSTVGNVSNLELLKEFGEVIYYEVTHADQTIERSSDADIIITNKVIIDKKVMDTNPGIKLICIAATGMNNVDLDYAAEKGIVVRNVSGYSTFSVTQSTFAMLFSLFNSIHYYDHYVKSGSYSRSPIFTNHGREFAEIKGMTFGIIGLGVIGKSVAKIAEAFGCRVVYHSTSGKNTSQSYPCLGLDELLSESDIVSIHAPLNEQTDNLIDMHQLKIMKPTAVLINAGRGNIVNETGLAHAIDNEIIAGAALDVFGNEPIQADNPLLKIRRKENLILAPHIAWASKESRETLIKGIHQNIAEFIDHA